MNSFKAGSLALGGLVCAGITGTENLKAGEKPRKENLNFIIIFADDMGYGDMGINGHPTIKTPNLDRMAFEGQKWTNFYSGAPVSTPSRAALLTGRLPVRNGMCGKRGVLFPDSKGGLPPTEITIAKALQTAGYQTACIGKWHLGHLPQYSPNAHGFGYYFGIPYSNDMDRLKDSDYRKTCTEPKIDYFNVPLMRNSEIIERPADQTTITRRYTNEAVGFIRKNLKNRFFLYLAHSMPHVPLFRSPEFENKSLRGIYGDVIEELDWSVGQILNELRKTGLDKNTIVVFTSDNGPWLMFNDHGGSAGLLTGGKGGTFEGGMREPAIFWCPGKIIPHVVMDMATTMDILPTFTRLANANLPSDRIYDGVDISPLLFGTGQSKRDVVFYYRDTEIYAIRKGAFKAHFATKQEYGDNVKHEHNPPLLFNLNEDPSEKYNVAQKYPEVIREIEKIRTEHQKTITPVENQIDK